MSKFLKEFIDDVIWTNVSGEGFGDINVDWDSIDNKINQLGENAKLMLEIGIVQDRLVELGFTPRNGYFLKMHYKDILELNLEDGALYSYNLENLFFNIDFKSQRWQEDLINKVKELIKG